MRTSQLSKQKNLIYTESEFSNEDIQYIWNLHTLNTKNRSIEYLIIPDGSIDIIFELHDRSIYNPVISAPFENITKIKLPRNSNYLGLRFKPGKFRKYFDIDLNKITDNFIELERKEYSSISVFFNSLKNNRNNPLKIFNNDLSHLLHSSLSQRQKRRIFKCTTGFTIRQFTKIMNFQESLLDKSKFNYFDQSHQIKVYKSLVNMTPKDLQRYI